MITIVTLPRLDVNKFVVVIPIPIYSEGIVGGKIGSSWSGTPPVWDRFA